VGRNTLWRSADEIHVEAICNPTVFSTLMRYVQIHPDVFVMLTTLDEPWIKLRIQADKLSLADYEIILTERYLALAKVSHNIGLHVHLFHPQSIQIPSYCHQYDKIREAKCFLERLGLPWKDFASGWFGYNADTIRTCETLGIRRFHIPQFYNGCEKSDLMAFHVVRNCLHDWEL
jgi:hypothetical protein